MSRPIPPEPPRHGDRGSEPTAAAHPGEMTVAISREAGAGGVTIARTVAEKLGWQLFDQDMLTFLANDEPARHELYATIPESALAWADLQLPSRLKQSQGSPDAELIEAVKLTLALGARGGVVLVGRGAGCMLPNDTTLHVRIVSPMEVRVGYMAQRLRLSQSEAAAEVESRDRKRAELFERLTGSVADNANNYDLTLNSARLGYEVAAELILCAIRSKSDRVESAKNPFPPPMSVEPV